MEYKALKISAITGILIIIVFIELPRMIPSFDLTRDCGEWENKRNYYWKKITPERVEDCLNNGANIKVRGGKGHTLLHRAAYSNQNSEVIKIFLDAGIDANERTDGEFTPLHTASANDSLEVIKALLDAGADANAKADNGARPIIGAGFNKNPEVIIALVQAGADVNARDDAGDTSLHMAVSFNKNTQVILTLLELGADVKIKDGEGKTPIDLAKKWGYDEDSIVYKALENAQH